MTAFRPLVVLLVCVGVLGVQAASAAPDTPTTLTYEFKNCVGSYEEDFRAVKQPSGAAGLQVVEFKATFVFMESIDAAGNVEFTTPGFEHNGLPTVTCDLFLSGEEFLVKGLLVPVKKEK